MKKLTKYIKVSLFAILFVFFCSSFVQASEEYKYLNVEGTVPINKEFHINFNQALIETDFNQFIEVIDVKTNLKVPIKVTIEAEKNKLKLCPLNGYDLDKSYKIVIDKNLTSSAGKALNKSVEINFKTVATNASISTYKEYYSLIQKALENCDDSLKLQVENYDKTIFNLDVVNKIVREHPDNIMGYKEAEATICTYGDGKTILDISFKYNDTKENIIKKKQLVNDKVQKIKTQIIKPGMSDIQKEKAIHDYVVNNTTYDKRLFAGNMPEDSYSDYGVLINKTGVCQGYALAMYKLLRSCNIEVYVVLGEAYTEGQWGGHAWNMVKINGRYYHIDATWDDPTTADGRAVLTHDYFNVSDAFISKDHRWDRSLYPL